MVSTGSKVEWKKMGTEEDGFCYDEIKLGSEAPWKFRAGEENFIADLVKEFPEEEEGIREYVRLCKRANKKADMYFYGKVSARGEGDKNNNSATNTRSSPRCSPSTSNLCSIST